MKHITALFFCILGILGVQGQNIENIESFIDQITSDWSENKPGGAIGIVHNGELIFNKAFGLASLEFDVKNNAETMFNIASVSKQITAFALVLLDKEGKIDLDDDIRKYLPEIPDFGNTITIRNLLTHTSGMRNFQNLLSIAGWRDGDPMSNDDLLKYMTMQNELNFPTGEEYLYCNTGFVLATFIVERVTGQDFKQWTKENIFIPLGMKKTEFREDMEVIHKNTASGYSCSDEQCTKPLEFYTYMGNGNVYTNIEEFSKWMINFKTAKVGGTESIQNLWTRGILNNGDTLNYALGIGVNQYRGLNRVTHGGSIGGYRSSMSYFPDFDFGVFVFTNGSDGNPGGKANQIMEHCLAEFLTPASTSSARIRRLNQATKTTKNAFEKIANQYIVDGIKVDLYQREEQFYISAEGIIPELPLSPASDTSFFNVDADISIYVNVGKELNDNTIEGIFANDYFFGRAFNPKLHDHEFTDLLLGTYYSAELDTKYKLEFINNQLMVTHRRHYPALVTPVTEKLLTADAFHFAEAVIIYEDNAVKGIKVSNGRVRDIWFEKLD